MTDWQIGFEAFYHSLLRYEDFLDLFESFVMSVLANNPTPDNFGLAAPCILKIIQFNSRLSSRGYHYRSHLTLLCRLIGVTGYLEAIPTLRQLAGLHASDFDVEPNLESIVSDVFEDIRAASYEVIWNIGGIDYLSDMEKGMKDTSLLVNRIVVSLLGTCQAKEVKILLLRALYSARYYCRRENGHIDSFSSDVGSALYKLEFYGKSGLDFDVHEIVFHILSDYDEEFTERFVEGIQKRTLEEKTIFVDKVLELMLQYDFYVNFSLFIDVLDQLKEKEFLLERITDFLLSNPTFKEKLDTIQKQK